MHARSAVRQRKKEKNSHTSTPPLACPLACLPGHDLRREGIGDLSRLFICLFGDIFPFFCCAMSSATRTKQGRKESCVVLILMLMLTLISRNPRSNPLHLSGSNCDRLSYTLPPPLPFPLPDGWVRVSVRAGSGRSQPVSALPYLTWPRSFVQMEMSMNEVASRSCT